MSNSESNGWKLWRFPQQREYEAEFHHPSQQKDDAHLVKNEESQDVKRWQQSHRHHLGIGEATLVTRSQGFTGCVGSTAHGSTRSDHPKSEKVA